MRCIYRLYSSNRTTCTGVQRNTVPCGTRTMSSVAKSGWARTTSRGTKKPSCTRWPTAHATWRTNRYQYHRDRSAWAGLLSNSRIWHQDKVMPGHNNSVNIFIWLISVHTSILIPPVIKV